MTSPTDLDTEETSRRRSTPLPGVQLGQPAAGSDYDGRHQYAPPGGAPKPPPGIWAEMEAAGAAGDDYLLAVARAKYAAWLTEQGWHEGVHGAELPDGAIR